MAGITRVSITDEIKGRGAWRFRDAHRLWPVANIIYRQIFPSLLDGYDELRVTKEAFDAGYDRMLGVDVFLEFDNGQQLTMQEKFLFTSFNTVTVEHYQNWETEEPGDWFNLKNQLYFVGYDFPKTGKRFTSWIMLDWPMVVKLTTDGALRWRQNQNERDGARSDFKYLKMDRFPDSCIIAKSGA